MKRRPLLIAFGCLVVLAISGCGVTGPSGAGRAPDDDIGLGNCSGRPPTATVTTTILSSTAHSIYLGSGGNLYAFDAHNGAMRWCRQVSITRKFTCPAAMSCPAGPFIYWGQPAVADGVVYVCASGYGSGLLYAFRADTGALLWRAASGCQAVSMPYGDNAVPLVSHGIVYSGSHALRARDGSVLWTARTGASGGYTSPQALANGLLYANDDTSVYAVNASDGSVRWKFTAPDGSPPGDSLAYADGRVYYGTLDSVDGSETSHLYALDAASGALLWKSPMAAYSAATLTNGVIYLGSANNTLYALQASNGAVRWRTTGASGGYDMTATVANGVVYAIQDGAYALDAATGRVIWHQPLRPTPDADFTPIAVAGQVAYLARTDGEGNSVLYALNAGSGAVCWQSSEIHQVTPLVVG